MAFLIPYNIKNQFIIFAKITFWHHITCSHICYYFYRSLHHSRLDMWGWSHVYRILKFWHVFNGPQSPWKHNHHKWSKLEEILLEYVKNEYMSLEDDWSNIMGVLKIHFEEYAWFLYTTSPS